MCFRFLPLGKGTATEAVALAGSICPVMADSGAPSNADTTGPSWVPFEGEGPITGLCWDAPIRPPPPHRQKSNEGVGRFWGSVLEGYVGLCRGLGWGFGRVWRVSEAGESCRGLRLGDIVVLRVALVKCISVSWHGTRRPLAYLKRPHFAVSPVSTSATPIRSLCWHTTAAARTFCPRSVWHRRPGGCHPCSKCVAVEVCRPICPHPPVFSGRTGGGGA